MDESGALFSGSPYEHRSEWRDRHFRRIVIDLTKHHQVHCEAYKRVLDGCGFVLHEDLSLEELPFLPSGLFKYSRMVSVPLGQERVCLESSGTTGQRVSRIYLDGETSTRQMRALTHIVSDFLGKERLPLIVLDRAPHSEKRAHYSARTAAIEGFSLFGKNRTFALTDSLQLDVEAIQKFLTKVDGRRFFAFGFTYLIWEHFIVPLERLALGLDFSEAVLIHGGGWKHLLERRVSDEEFRSSLERLTGLRSVYDYYGMAEQVGSIYMQCEKRYFHCSSFSDVFFRRPGDFSLCALSEPGILQSISSLPRSYPGHSLLTEDTGMLVGEDDCACGRRGKYFKVNGRLRDAGIKGCGDAYAAAD